MRNGLWRELDRTFFVIPIGRARRIVFNFGPWSHAVCWEWVYKPTSEWCSRTVLRIAGAPPRVA